MSDKQQSGAGVFPLSHPEIEPLLPELLTTLVGESDRGAVLIGAAHVDEYLTRLLSAVMPKQYSKRRRKDLFGYGGALGSYHGKVEIAYALRLISRTLYDALHALRRIRNDVAHSPGAFQMRGQEDRVRKIYALGPDFPEGLRGVALQMMMDYKSRVVVDAAQELAEETGIQPKLESKADVMEYLADSPEVIEALEDQLPQWEMVLGIAMLCAMLVWHRDRALEVLNSNDLWSDVART